MEFYLEMLKLYLLKRSTNFYKVHSPPFSLTNKMRVFFTFSPLISDRHFVLFELLEGKSESVLYSEKSTDMAVILTETYLNFNYGWRSPPKKCRYRNSCFETVLTVNAIDA